MENNDQIQEKVDIVDEKLSVLYSEDKSVAHEKGLLHPTIVAELINEKGEWLLVKQSGHKQDAGQFVSPVGGHVKSGESELDALKRETLEEVGVGKFNYRRKGQFIFKRTVGDKVENHFFILYEIYSEEDPVLNDESVGFERFSVGDLKRKLNDTPEIFGKAFHVVARNFYPHLFFDGE